MSRLSLIFVDENRDEQRVAVEGEIFTVGRHSSNDLTISDSRLSREHIRIELVNGEYIASDCGSSNGTTINGSKLNGETKLRDGDELDLGGGLQMTVELKAKVVEAADPAPIPEAAVPVPPAQSANIPAATAATPAGGIPMSFFIIAPLMGLFVLLVVGGAFYFFAGTSKLERADAGDDYDYSSNEDDDIPASDDDDDGLPKASKTQPPAPGASPSKGPTGPSTSPGSGGTDVPPAKSGETAKIERNGGLFLRRMAQNDPTAFLTGEQAKRVDAKIKQLSRSSAIAENINSARKNASQIKALAASKNLQPQFLAVAAITKLGTGRGDIMQAATSVADVYDKLSVPIGHRLADDSLLMVAAYDQGAAGETLKMRNMLQALTKANEGAREIRSIWYLEKNGKITQAEFDRALSFLAIGTISENPKEFGLNAEALTL